MFLYMSYLCVIFNLVYFTYAAYEQVYGRGGTKNKTLASNQPSAIPTKHKSTSSLFRAVFIITHITDWQGMKVINSYNCGYDFFAQKLYFISQRIPTPISLSLFYSHSISWNTSVCLVLALCPPRRSLFRYRSTLAHPYFSYRYVYSTLCHEVFFNLHLCTNTVYCMKRITYPFTSSSCRPPNQHHHPTH